MNKFLSVAEMNNYWAAHTSHYSHEWLVGRETIHDFWSMMDGMMFE